MNNSQIDFIRNDCLNVLSDVSALDGLKNQSVYMTGAAGFMGSWLLELISCLNDEFNFNINVVATSRNWDEIEKERSHLYNKEYFSFLTVDVRHTFDIPEDCKWIIHLAGTPDRRFHASDPLNTINSIIRGTENLLNEASRITNLNKIVCLSSGHIYGKQPAKCRSIDEENFFPSDCTNTIECYIQAKRMAENICQIYRSQMRLPIAVLRPFSFIGPYQLVSRPWAINNFIYNALRGRSIRIEGNCNTVRSYMYPSDMAYWILKYMQDSDDGDFLNLGSSDGQSLLKIAQLVAQNSDNNPSIETALNADSVSPSYFVPNVKKAKTKYGLKVNIPLEESIKRTVQWLKDE